MQPVDDEADFDFSSDRSFPTVPTICLMLFALALAIPSSGTTTAACVVLLSALLSSIAGFAFSPIAGVVLFHTSREPVAVVQILLVASIAQQVYCVWHLRGTIRVRKCAPYLFGSVSTLPIGIYLLCKTSASDFLPLLGLLLIIYGAFTTVKPKLHARTNPLWGQVAVGALGGITGGLAAFPAAFVSMWSHLQGFEKNQTRSIIQPFILTNQILSLFLLMVVRPTEVVPISALRYAAPAVLGAYCGLMIFQRVDTSTFNRVLGLLLIAAGLGFVMPA